MQPSDGSVWGTFPVWVAWESAVWKAERDPDVRGVIRTIVWTAATSGLIPVGMAVLSDRRRGVDGPGVWAGAVMSLIIGGLVTCGMVLGLRRGRRGRD